MFSPLLAEDQAKVRLGGGPAMPIGDLGWVRATGRSDRPGAGEDADSGTGDHSFMFVIGLGVNLTVSDRVGLSLEARYNHARNVFDESAKWIPVTAFVVILL